MNSASVAISAHHTDNLGSDYSKAADNGQHSHRRREAAVLFAVAEGHLDAGAAAEALGAAGDALQRFREAGDAVGQADSLRLASNASVQLAGRAHLEGRGREEAQLLECAEQRARAELAAFGALDDGRGQASMLLALGEVLAELGGGPRCAEALDCLMDARDLAREAGDAKLEGLAALAHAQVLHRRRRYGACSRACAEAAALLRGAGDRKNEAFAWYTGGSAELDWGNCREGLRKRMQAHSIWKELGDQTRLEAHALYSIAQVQMTELLEHQAGEAAAQEASELFLRLGQVDRVLHVQILRLEACVRRHETKRAVERGAEALEFARSKGTARDVFLATGCLAKAHLFDADFQECLERAGDCLSLSDAIGDPRYRAQALELLAWAYDSFDDLNTAEKKAEEAVSIMQNMHRYEADALRCMQLLARIRIKRLDYSGAEDVLLSARKLGQRAEDAYLEATALLGLSGAQALQHRFEKAQKAAALARELYQEEGFVRGEGNVLKSMTDYYVEQGNMIEAIRAATEGARLMERGGDLQTACTLKQTVAHVYIVMDHLSDALAAAMEALRLARLNEKKRVLAEAILTVLDAHNLIVNEAGAEERQTQSFWQSCCKMMRFAKEALGITVDVRDPHLEAQASYWVLHVHILLGNFCEAQRASASVVSLAREAKDFQLEVHALLAQGQAHMAMREHAKSTDVLKAALRLAQQSSYEQGQRIALDIMRGMAQPQEQEAVQPAQPAAALAVRDHEAGAGGGEPRRSPEPASVRSFIAEQVRQMAGVDEVPAEMPLMESCLDSLSSIELRTRLQQEFRVCLPATVTFSHPSVNGIADVLVGECAKIESGEPGGAL